MDGVEAVRRIRNVPKLAGTPIFIVSAYVTDAVRADVLSAGGAEVFLKPFNTDRLLESIERALNRS
jgi:CheY-like chemotaxis protein